MNIKQHIASILNIALLAVFAGGMMAVPLLPAAPSDAATAPNLGRESVIMPAWNSDYAKAFPQCKNMDTKPESVIAKNALVINIYNEPEIMDAAVAWNLIQDEDGPTLWTIGYCS